MATTTPISPSPPPLTPSNPRCQAESAALRVSSAMSTTPMSNMSTQTLTYPIQKESGVLDSHGVTNERKDLQSEWRTLAMLLPLVTKSIYGRPLLTPSRGSPLPNHGILNKKLSAEASVLDAIATLLVRDKESVAVTTQQNAQHLHQCHDSWRKC